METGWMHPIFLIIENASLLGFRGHPAAKTGVTISAIFQISQYHKIEQHSRYGFRKLMTGVGCRFNPVSKDNACNGVLRETWLMLRKTCIGFSVVM